VVEDHPWLCQQAVAMEWIDEQQVKAMRNDATLGVMILQDVMDDQHGRELVFL
jgi:hypothetical protein